MISHVCPTEYWEKLEPAVCCLHGCQHPKAESLLHYIQNKRVCVGHKRSLLDQEGISATSHRDPKECLPGLLTVQSSFKPRTCFARRLRCRMDRSAELKRKSTPDRAPTSIKPDQLCWFFPQNKRNAFPLKNENTASSMSASHKR